MGGGREASSEILAVAAYAGPAASQQDALLWPPKAETARETVHVETALSQQKGAREPASTPSRAPIGNAHPSLEDESPVGPLGGKKQRPVSMGFEVVVPRTRTASGQGDTSWEQSQSQSPTKKQRIESTETQPTTHVGARSSPFSVPVSTATNAAVNGVYVSSSQDSQIVSTTQDFSNLSTTTPSATARHASPQGVATAARSSISSKHSSPTTSKQRPTPVVEIPFKAPSLPGSLASTPAKEEKPQPSDVVEAVVVVQDLAKLAVDHTLRQSAPRNGDSSAEIAVNHEDPGGDELAYQPTRVVSPELEDTSPKKARSRKVSPQGLDLDSSTEMIAKSQLEIAQPVHEPDHTQEQSMAEGALPPSDMFINSNDKWFKREKRGAAQQKSSYNEETETEDDSASAEASMQTLPRRKTQKIKAPKAPALSFRKESAGVSASESDHSAGIVHETSAAAHKNPSRVRAKAKSEKQSSAAASRGQKKPVAPQKASTARRSLAKSKSEGALAFGKDKITGRRRRGTDSSSEGEVLFGTPQTSPAKKARTIKQHAAKARAQAPHEVITHATQKSTYVSRRKSASSGSDGSLPPVPFSSQGPSAPRAFDIFDLEEDVFVTIRAKRKPEANDESTSTASGSQESAGHSDPVFWWPARIENRNRLKFTVSLVTDEPEETILEFSQAAFVIPPEDLREERIRNLQDFYTGEIAFATPAKAYHNVRTSLLREKYALPTDAAFKSALRVGRRIVGKEFEEAVANSGGKSKKRTKDLRPSGLTPGKKSAGQRKRKTKAKALSDPGGRSGTETSGSEIERIRAGAMIQPGSDSDDLDSDIELDTICLAKDRTTYWPCRVIGIERPAANADKSKKGGPSRSRPYHIEFYPPQLRWVARNNLVLKDDPQFYNVPIGEIARKDKGKTNLIPEKAMENILLDMRDLTMGEYEPGIERHQWFFSTDAGERAFVAIVGVYGQFEEDQIKQLSDYLTDWLLGKTGGNIAAPAEELVNTLHDDLRKSEYVVQVLLPTALELIYLNDDETIEQRALNQLHQQGLQAPTPSQIRLAMHRIAAHEMRESTEWWETLLNLRKAQDDREFMKQKMATQLDEDDIRAMGLEVGRKRKNLNYKE